MNLLNHPHVTLENGKAFVKDTRLPVIRLWNWHQKGVSVHSLVKRYPSLGWAKVLDALSWAYDNKEHVEQELADEQHLIETCSSVTMEQLKLRGIS